MLKTDVIRSLSLGSVTLFALVFLLNPGTLALSKLPLFEPFEPFGPIVTAVDLDSQHLIKPWQLAVDAETIDSRYREYPDVGTGVLQAASVCGYKRLFGKDKEYPCLIE